MKPLLPLLQASQQSNSSSSTSSSSSSTRRSQKKSTFLAAIKYASTASKKLNNRNVTQRINNQPLSLNLVDDVKGGSGNDHSRRQPRATNNESTLTQHQQNQQPKTLKNRNVTQRINNQPLSLNLVDNVKGGSGNDHSRRRPRATNNKSTLTQHQQNQQPQHSTLRFQTNHATLPPASGATLHIAIERL